jgi:hypothetical protein
MAGTFVAQPDLQALLWAIDGLGLVVATALLALKYARMGHDLVAAGISNLCDRGSGYVKEGLHEALMSRIFEGWHV